MLMSPSPLPYLSLIKAHLLYLYLISSPSSSIGITTMTYIAKYRARGPPIVCAMHDLYVGMLDDLCPPSQATIGGHGPSSGH